MFWPNKLSGCEKRFENDGVIQTLLLFNEVQLIYNIVLVLGTQLSDSVFFFFFKMMSHFELLKGINIIIL